MIDLRLIKFKKKDDAYNNYYRPSRIIEVGVQIELSPIDVFNQMVLP